MHVENQIGTWIETPAHVRRFGLYHRAGLPKQEVRVQIEEIGASFGNGFHARETRLAILPLAPAQRLSAVDPEIGMMHDLLCAGPQFNGANVRRLIQLDG